MPSGGGPRTERGILLMRRAQTLSEAGWRVFPWGIKPGSDRAQPLWRGYFGDRPFDASRLVSPTWDVALGVGIACPSHVLGLDVDIKGGKQGLVQIASLGNELGPLPDGPLARTPSGGEHRLFQRRLIPVTARLRSHVGLPDGVDADIDLIHGGYRYFKVYDDRFWLDLDHSNIPEIPQSWHVALLKGPSGRPKVRRESSALPPAATGSVLDLQSETLACLLHAVRSADQNRNVTLNRNYFRAVLTGFDSDVTREHFRQAALQCGLPPSEVDETLASAFNAARDARAFIGEWEAAVAALAERESPRTRLMLMLVAQVAVQTYLVAEDPEHVGLSCRELAERANISRATAARHLKRLKNMGLLARSGWRHEGEANRYRFRIPQRVHSETVTHARRTRLSHYFTAGDGANERRALLSIMLQHDAFARLGMGPTLPPSCAEILVALLEGERTAADLRALMGYSRPTVRRALQILQSCGLVDSATPNDKVRLLGADPMLMLDEWTQWMGVRGRREHRREVHQAERASYSEQRVTKKEQWARTFARWPRLAERVAAQEARQRVQAL